MDDPAIRERIDDLAVADDDYDAPITPELGSASLVTPITPEQTLRQRRAASGAPLASVRELLEVAAAATPAFFALCETLGAEPLAKDAASCEAGRGAETDGDASARVGAQLSSYRF